MQGRVASRMPRVVVVSENSIKDIHTDMKVALVNDGPVTILLDSKARE